MEAQSVSKHLAPTPPKHLQPTTAAWFRSVISAYTLEEHHVRLLTAACILWDRAMEARAALAANGTVYTDRFNAPRPRPELVIERDSLAGFRAMVKQLGLDDGEPPPAGPPRFNAKGIR